MKDARYFQKPALSCQTDHEELAQGDVRENVVGLVLATGEAWLLPEAGELLQQRPAGAQV